AGIRETDDLVEQIGVERTKTAITDADFIIVVIESNSRLPREEMELLNQFPINLCVINKCDLGIALTESALETLSSRSPIVKVSALTGEGIEQLRQTIYRQLTTDTKTNIEDAIITNERHYNALESTVTALCQAKRDLSAGFTEEIALTNLHHALRSLGVITGETLMTEIINQIFSTFC